MMPWQFHRAKGWDVSKKIQNGETDIALNENTARAETSEKFTISNAEMTGLASLRRSKSASLIENEVI